jgi:LPS-assembly protein
MLRALALLAALWGTGLAAQGGPPPNMVADNLTVTADRRLVAEGNVEIWFDGNRLQARALSYDPASDRLQITGPILITTGSGAILTADSATLDPALQDGLLRGARLILDRQLQLAANRIDRVDGRYNALTQVAATSCTVCPGAAPVWEIRAARVIHDEAEQQLYFENATLRVGGVPVLWLPRIRLPDPTLDRAAGILVPQLRTTNRLGTGIRLPYFIPLGPDRDLTLTPYLSAETQTLGWRYRQALANGDVTFGGAFSRDTLQPGTLRGNITGSGTFTLANGGVLSFTLEGTRDTAYLQDYGLTDRDRLESALTYARVLPDRATGAELAYYTSLRPDEDAGSLPPLVLSFATVRRLQPAVGGTLSLGLDGLAYYRPDDSDGALGRDVARLGAEAAWRDSWTIGPGLLLQADGSLRADLYAIRQDDELDDRLTSATAAAGLTLRWPLIRRGTGGTTHLLEPVAALTWTGATGDQAPAEDSVLPEFDEGNLLALRPLPGADGRPTGGALTLGLNYSIADPAGREIGLSFGRIFRTDPLAATASAGLSGTASDWLIAARFDLADNLTLRARSLLRDDGTTAKTEARLDWQGARIDMAAAYIFLPADAAEAREDDISEWAFDAAYQLSDAWRLSAQARYDVAQDRPALAGLGVIWQSDCVTVDLSVTRRYTDTDAVSPDTDIGLSVSLGGFSAGRPVTDASRTCRD